MGSERGPVWSSWCSTSAACNDERPRSQRQRAISTSPKKATVMAASRGGRAAAGAVAVAGGLGGAAAAGVAGVARPAAAGAATAAVGVASASMSSRPAGSAAICTTMPRPASALRSDHRSAASAASQCASAWPSISTRLPPGRWAGTGGQRASGPSWPPSRCSDQAASPVGKSPADDPATGGAPTGGASTGGAWAVISGRGTIRRHAVAWARQAQAPIVAAGR